LPRPGDVVAGKYRVESVIGTGGMGVVIGAQDTSLGRPVAIKFLAPHKARRDGAVARFLREARAAASIQSEHVVRVYEVGTLPNGSPYIVMEHLRGADLSQIVGSRGGLPIDESIDYILQACEAIGEAHGRGIVHRDLKPQNLFVVQKPDGSPLLKVLDFGISKALDEEAPNLTSTDQVMGTPLYMSPEQVRSLKNVDQRSDIWALGSILFELLTASPIYEAPSATALCAMIAMDPPTPLRAKRPGASPALEAVILRCLHKDPAGRFQDVAALAEALAQFASSRGRQSVTRISRVVRSGPHDPAVTFATAGSGPALGPHAATTSDATGGIRASYAPFGPSYPPPVIGLSNHPPPNNSAPPPPHMTTEQNWQQTGTGTQNPRGTSSVVVALLGVLTGVALLGLLGVGGYVYISRENAGVGHDAGVLPAARPTAPAVGPTGPGGTSALVPAVPATTPTTPTPAIGPDPTPGKKPEAIKDAGAPQAKKDAGAPARKDEDDLEARRRLAEQGCAHQRFLLTTNDPKNNNMAKQVKTATCLPAMGPQAATCQRNVCRSACSMIQDQDCIRQLDYAERSLPTKF